MLAVKGLTDYPFEGVESFFLGQVFVDAAVLGSMERAQFLILDLLSVVYSCLDVLYILVC